MRNYKEEIINLSSLFDSNTLLYMNSLIKYYKSNKKVLNVDELEILASKIEKCRKYYNKKNKNTIRESEINIDINLYLEKLKHKK